MATLKHAVKIFSAIVCLTLVCGFSSAGARQQKEGGVSQAAKLASRPGLIRPSIFLDAAHVAELEKRAQRGSPYWDRLQGWALDPARKNTDAKDGPGLALFWLVQRESSPGAARPLGRLAVDCALKSVEAPAEKDLILASRQVADAALTLDWAWGAFQPEERDRIARWLVATARRFAKSGLGCFTGESAAAFRLAAMAGCASRGLLPEADELIQEAVEKRFKKRLLPCLTNGGSGGGWFEGSHGGARAGLWLIEAAAALETAAGIDLISRTPWFGDRIGYLMFDQLPGSVRSSTVSYRRPSPDGDAFLPQDLAADMLRLQSAMLTRLLPEHPMTGWALNLLLDRRAPAVVNQRFYPMEFVWLDLESIIKPMATAPLTFWAPSLGRGFSRSDWSLRATWLKLSSGPHYAYPQHLNATGLQLYRRGFLLPPAGGFDGPATEYAQNYGIRSLAHNTIIIRDPEEYSWPDMRSGIKPKGTYSNDGGMRAWSLFNGQGRSVLWAPWNPEGWSLGQRAWDKFEPVYKVAGLDYVEERPRFAYLRAEAARAYQGSTLKAERVVRHVFHLRAGGPQDATAAEVVAVVDDVSVAHDRVKVGYSLHFPQAPKADGNLEEIGPGRKAGKAKALEMVQDKARLGVVQVWPPEAMVELYQGRAAGRVGGKNYSPKPPAAMLASNRADVFPLGRSGKSRPQVFALLPADADGPPHPVIKPLAESGQGVVGMVVMDKRWPRVVAVRLGPPDPGAGVAYARPSVNSRNVVAGLAPDKRYAVEVGEKAISIKPSPQGRFTSSASGALWFLATPRGAGPDQGQ